MGKRCGDSRKKSFFVIWVWFWSFFGDISFMCIVTCARPKNINWYCLLLSTKINIQTIRFNNYCFGIYIIVIKMLKILRLLFIAYWKRAKNNFCVEQKILSYSNGNASETKVNESFDNGVFFDIEAKRTPSIVSKLFSKRSEHIR